MFPRFPLVILAASLVPVSLAPAAPSKTPSAKKSAPIKGLMTQGEGVATLSATFGRGTSNLSGAPFTSIGRSEPRRPGGRRRIVSSSIARLSNGYCVVVNFIAGRTEGDLGPPRPERDVEKGRPESIEDRDERLKRPTGTFMLTFASPGGFRVGQTIPIIKPVYSAKPRPANAILTYDDIVRIEGRDVFDGNGKRIRTSRNATRGWIAEAGTVRIQSVSADKITFSIQNARFSAPVKPGMMGGPNTNAGRGTFTLNGVGQSTFNEVD